MRTRTLGLNKEEGLIAAPEVESFSGLHGSKCDVVDAYLESALCIPVT